jgi:hypothetical protein
VSRSHRATWLIAACLLVTAAAAAEPVTTIRDNGDAANRIDIVVLGDGYSAADLASGKYAADVEKAIIGLFSDQPYTEYQRYFNVHRVDVTSAESGADHPLTNIFRDTALEASFDCGGIERLVCVNTSTVNSVLTESIAAPNARDVVLVLVNDDEYGGSGGAIAVASTHPASVELVLHEIGHSFALLADEYDSSPPTCYDAAEPPEANVTNQTTRPAIKWSLWIDPVTPLPTPGSTETPGLYQGAKYCATGLYRPTFNSKMRSLGRPFGAVNSEAHIRRIYNFVTPLDSALPQPSTLTLRHGTMQPASVTVPLPFTHALTVTWLVDDVAAGTGTSFVLDTSSLSVGAHVMRVSIADDTAMVRNDPIELLRTSRTWEVMVTASFSDHPLNAGTPIKAVHITELRDRINALRSRCDLDTLAFTDASLVPGATVVRWVHVAELRTALLEAYGACGAAPPAFTDPGVTGGIIRAIHVSELRSAVLALE